MKDENNNKATDSDARQVEALVIPLVYEKFEAGKLHLIFADIERIGETAFGGHHYILRDSRRGNDIVELFYYGEDERQWRFIVDNFPGQRKIYNTNMPYETFGDFADDLRRIGVKNLYVAPEAV